VEPADGSDGTDGRWKVAQKVTADRVISTVDPHTRHADKTVEHRRDGFKAHVVIEPEAGHRSRGDRPRRVARAFVRNASRGRR
jgi:hypothetical protein